MKTFHGSKILATRLESSLQTHKLTQRHQTLSTLYKNCYKSKTIHKCRHTITLATTACTKKKKLYHLLWSFQKPKQANCFSNSRKLNAESLNFNEHVLHCIHKIDSNEKTEDKTITDVDNNQYHAIILQHVTHTSDQCKIIHTSPLTTTWVNPNFLC